VEEMVEMVYSIPFLELQHTMRVAAEAEMVVQELVQHLLARAG
jgi:hypothetical protein